MTDTFNSVSQEFEKIERDKPKALILRINSAGGLKDAGDGIHEYIMQKKEKLNIPVVSFIEGLGASAAYKVATAADQIYATPSSRVGSIGTIVTMVDVSKKLEKEGVSVKRLSSGKHKLRASVSPDPIGEQELADELLGIREASEEFYDVVSKRRGIEKERIRGYEGKAFSSKEALKEGLIDGISDFSGIKELVLKENHAKLENTVRELSKNTSTMTKTLEELAKEEAYEFKTQAEILLKEKAELQRKLESYEVQLTQAKESLLSELGVFYQQATSEPFPQELLSSMKNSDISIIKGQVDAFKKLAGAKWSAGKQQQAIECDDTKEDEEKKPFVVVEGGKPQDEQGVTEEYLEILEKRYGKR